MSELEILEDATVGDNGGEAEEEEYETEEERAQRKKEKKERKEAKKALKKEKKEKKKAMKSEFTELESRMSGSKEQDSDRHSDEDPEERRKRKELKKEKKRLKKEEKKRRKEEESEWEEDGGNEEAEGGDEEGEGGDEASERERSRGEAVAASNDGKNPIIAGKSATENIASIGDGRHEAIDAEIACVLADSDAVLGVQDSDPDPGNSNVSKKAEFHIMKEPMSNTSSTVDMMSGSGEVEETTHTDETVVNKGGRGSGNSGVERTASSTKALGGSGEVDTQAAGLAGRGISALSDMDEFVYESSATQTPRSPAANSGQNADGQQVMSLRGIPEVFGNEDTPLRPQTTPLTNPVANENNDQTSFQKARMCCC